MSTTIRYPVRKLIFLTQDQAKRIEDFRFENRLPSENEAIRYLIELGLLGLKNPEEQKTLQMLRGILEKRS